jgi:hypothetical protein
MNLPIATVETASLMTWHLLLESLADGQVAASVAELPDCRVVAASREAAIALLEPLVDDRMAAMEVVPFNVATQTVPLAIAPPHPLDGLPSIDKNDPAFIEFMAALRADRELDDDNPAYTINW